MATDRLQTMLNSGDLHEMLQQQHQPMMETMQVNHRPITTRDRRLQTPTTPSIVMSDIELIPQRNGAGRISQRAS